jgi:hypothetical protein
VHQRVVQQLRLSLAHPPTQGAFVRDEHAGHAAAAEFALDC